MFITGHQHEFSFLNIPCLCRPVVETIYQPPQVPDDQELDALVLKYMMDYRRVYIEHPRVRYDGVYIAVCHYMYERHLASSSILTELVVSTRRNGIGENVWVNVRIRFIYKVTRVKLIMCWLQYSHLITYYRYLCAST